MFGRDSTDFLVSVNNCYVIQVRNAGPIILLRVLEVTLNVTTASMM